MLKFASIHFYADDPNKRTILKLLDEAPYD